MIPKSVAKQVKERSQGIDELDGYGTANQFHHIKHKSQGGLDIAINILHVGPHNHPGKLHEDSETINRSYAILERRINETFVDQPYTPHEVADVLKTDVDMIIHQVQKGFLKTSFMALEGKEGYYATKEDIRRWLEPGKVRRVESE